MSIRKILYFPDPRLRKMSTPVEQFDDKLQTLIDDMFETMYDAQGVGLAAPQIGINLRLSVMDVSENKDQPMVLINPEIIASEGQQEFKEGCLSVPSAYDTVIRAQKVSVRAFDRLGQAYVIHGEGLLGECLQHEIDHLNGKLFIDLLSPLKRNIARKKLNKFIRQQPKQ